MEDIQLSFDDCFSEIQKATQIEKLKCCKTEMKDSYFATYEELFSGYNEIHAITFSYNINFIEKIMNFFEYGEILFGADFIVQKDNKLMTSLVNAFAKVETDGKIIRTSKTLSDRIRDREVRLKSSTFTLDHRKIYLLKSNTGRTRVILPSANMSVSAWNGEHMEVYTTDDTVKAYNYYMEEFTTAWNMATEIPYEIIVAKKTDNIVEANAIINKAIKTKETIVVQKPNNDDAISKIQYAIDYSKNFEKYNSLVKNVKPKSKNGLIEIETESVKKIISNAQRTALTTKTEEKYPELTFDFENETAILDNKILDLNPPKEEVKKEIEKLIEIFNNFDDFTGNVQSLKETHFKLMNLIFASPFFAKIRCGAGIRGISTDALPMTIFLTSPKANTGKTFMVKCILKMMSGKNVKEYFMSDLKNGKYSFSDYINHYQTTYKGIPVFVDEINNTFISNIKDRIIKNSGRICEENQIETMPLFIFAGNDIEQNNTIRKRAVYFPFNNGIKSYIDKSTYRSQGNAIIKNMGTCFYREYLRRMTKIVNDELKYINTKDISAKYYPDILKESSKVFIDIFNDYNIPLPDYIHELTYNKDYSEDAEYISETGIEYIKNLWTNNNDLFKINENHVVIEMAHDYETKKKLDNLEKTLPPEFETQIIPVGETIRIAFKKQELESRLGFLFETKKQKKSIWNWKRKEK